MPTRFLWSVNAAFVLESIEADQTVQRILCEKLRSNHSILEYFLTMKKEYGNLRNFIVKPTKNCEILEANSLIKVAAIERMWNVSGHVSTLNLKARINFQRFRQVRATMERAWERSILGQSARSGAKMARGILRQGARRRRIEPDEDDRTQMNQ